MFQHYSQVTIMCNAYLTILYVSIIRALLSRVQILFEAGTLAVSSKVLQDFEICLFIKQ